MKFSNEIKLMIACARVQVDPETGEKIGLLSRNKIDWDTFVKICIRHKVLPLVFQNLVLFCKDSFPEKLKTELENRYIFENSLHNFSLVEQLFFILDLLKKNEITAVPFKGPVLAENVFGDVGLRRYLDLDIFISKKDVLKAVDILMDKGFVPEEGNLPEGQEKKACLDRLVTLSLVRTDKQVSIDLQWDISNRFSNVPILLEDVKDHIEQVEINKRSILNLGPEILLCYLCLHGTKHRWLFLDSVCCVSELIRARDIDWHLTLKFAKRIHCTTVLLLGLYLARDLLGTRLPEHISQKMAQNKKLKSLAGKVDKGLFFNYMDTMTTSEKFDPFLVQVKDGFLDKIWYCLKVLFIPSKEDLRVFPLPESLSFIRYMLRPLRLVAEYNKRIAADPGN